MQDKGRTKFLILGLLAEGPRSGYEIRQITLKRFKFFWSESFGQIYPCLERLELEGAIEKLGSAGRGKTTWAITEAGRRSLSAWLSVDAQPETARFEAILKYYFSWAGPEEGRLRLLRAYLDRQERNLAELELFRQELLSVPDPQGNHDLALDSIELGIATYRAWGEWARSRLECHNNVTSARDPSSSSERPSP
jgi:PadR family transcriptional regulator, regulatory protein AphA